MNATTGKKTVWVLINRIHTSWEPRADILSKQFQEENPKWLVGKEECEPGRFMVSVYEEREVKE